MKRVAGECAEVCVFNLVFSVHLLTVSNLIVLSLCERSLIAFEKWKINLTTEQHAKKRNHLARRSDIIATFLQPLRTPWQQHSDILNY